MNKFFSVPLKWVALFVGNMILLAWACWDTSWSTVAPFIASIFFTVVFNLPDLLHRQSEYSIPYLQTFDGYKHRIVINNLDKISCGYEFTVFPSETVHAVLSDKIKGTVLPESRMTFYASELVNLTGESKVSSFLYIRPGNANVQILSESKNISTGLFEVKELSKKQI